MLSFERNMVECCLSFLFSSHRETFSPLFHSQPLNLSYIFVSKMNTGISKPEGRLRFILALSSSKKGFGN